MLEVFLEGGPDAEEDEGKSEGPVVSMSRSHERGLELPVEAFHEAVTLRVVAGSPIAADAEEKHDPGPYVSLKLAAAVGGKAERNTVS